MGRCCGDLRALLWKNWIVKSRHYVGLIFELLLPVAFIALFAWLKTLEENVYVPWGWSSTSDNDTGIGKSYSLFQMQNVFFNGLRTIEVPNYYFTETSVTGLVTTISVQSLIDVTVEDIQQLAIQCAPYVLQGQINPSPESCPVVPYRIAIVGMSDEYYEYFSSYIDFMYPQVTLASGVFPLVSPSLIDYFWRFNSSDELDEYCQSADYGRTRDNPRIFAGIELNSHPSPGETGSWEYTLRLNTSYVDYTNVLGGVSTRGSGVNTVQKTISTSDYQKYAIGGFMTLQSVVNRFMNCNPDPDDVTECLIASARTSDLSEERNQTMVEYLESDLNLIFTYELYNSVLNTSFGVANMSESELNKLLQPLLLAPQPVLGSTMWAFPIQSFIYAPFYDIVKSEFPLALLLAYMYAVSEILSLFIREKEKKYRETLKMIGVSTNTVINSWYITYFIIFGISVLLMTTVSSIWLFTASQPLLLFVFYLFFALDVVAFGFLLSTFFSKSKVGAIVGTVIFTIMFFGYYGVESPDVDFSTKAALFPLAPSMFALGVQTLASLEAVGVGVNFDNLYDEVYNWTMGASLSFMLFDFFFYTILAHYLEQVLPREWGVPRKWYFPFQATFWKEVFGVKADADADAMEKVRLSLAEDDSAGNGNIQPVGVDFQQQEIDGRALLIHSLRKVFDTPSGEKVAVDSLNMKMYEGQITCLLGHNGAGKTTTISMLTGLLAPSSGDAFINGYSIRDGMSQVRKSLGVCPQHDILYPELTVEEHLKLFGSLKGLSGRELDEECAKKIAEVGLTEKVKVRSKGLSGGMKRKLSLAIAFLGDSKVVFLDEPTSGMDPYSRRSTWDMIQNNRDGRVIVLTTHFMDEADLLGDRIAIMAEGQLRCCGSSLFLKNRFGVGYNLTIIRKENCNEAALRDIITSAVPETKILSDVGAELSFQLPLSASSEFSQIFSQLEDKKTELGIEEYGVSVTTLEEVFIKVAEVGNAEDQDLQQKLSKKLSHSLSESRLSDARTSLLQDSKDEAPEFNVSMVQNQNLFWRHFTALFKKRYRYAKRDKKAIVCNTVLPLIMLNVGLIILKTSSLLKDDPSYVMNFDAYAGSQTPTPYTCFPSEEDSWCTEAMGEGYFAGQANSIDGFEPFLTPDPTLFNISYQDLTVNGSESLSLKTSEYVYNSGYGYGGAQIPQNTQYGAYLTQTDPASNTFGYNMALNTTADHAAGIFKWAMDQSIYKVLSGDEDASVTLTNHPLVLSSFVKNRYNSFMSFVAITYMLIAVSFIPAAIVSFIVRERESAHNSKHQQLVSGAGLTAFWLANYLWDFLVYLFIYVVTLILIQAYNVSTFTGRGCTRNCTEYVFLAVAVLWFAFGLAIIPFTYLVSYLFSTATKAQNLVLLLNYLTGLVLMLVSFIMSNIESTQDVIVWLDFLFRIFPGFCLGNGMLNLSVTDIETSFGLHSEAKNAFSADLIGWSLVYLLSFSVLYTVLTIGVDVILSNAALKTKIFKEKDVRVLEDPLDEDVEREKQRVLSGAADDDVVKVQCLRKVYGGQKLAVRDLTFGIPRGECFGFLGINGAGKTTTMKIMTGEIPPTAGEGFICGYDILTEQLSVRSQIGYCPQFDALLDLLTVREHLELFASIKGAPKAMLDATVKAMMRQMDLVKFENKLAHTLSGGNKRKLSVGIALLGAPPVVFLDEPSTGMDPVARRFMWEVIAKVSTRSRSSCVILTTHSMEECEALSSKVGIMVGGRFRCFGSIQHLKARFGQGLMMEMRLDDVDREVAGLLASDKLGGVDYVVTPSNVNDTCELLGDSERAEMILSGTGSGWSMLRLLDRDGSVPAEVFCGWWIMEDRAEVLSKFMEKEFSGAELVERQISLFRYKLPKQDLRLSEVFSVIEKAKEELLIQEYSVSQTTLEQVFNQFASQQEEERATPRGIAKLPSKTRDGDKYVEIETP